MRAACAVLVALVSMALSACGGGSSDQATSLLRQTFTGSHPVNSGNLSFNLTLTPSGSSTLTAPITLSFGGPFQSLGAGRLPKSDFRVSFSAQGKTGTLGILSTGTSGYVTLQGNSYQLPATTFQRLESSFQQLASSPGGGSSSGTLSKLGIHPLQWLTGASVVGTESVGGIDTTHIRAGVNVAALLTDLNTFLHKASSVGVSGANRIPSSLSESTRKRIASEVQSPTFDVWTGKSDKTVRKLAIRLTVPVTGQIATALGGLRSAQIALTMQYADLNQPQTIAAPGTIRPFSEFVTKLRAFLQVLQGGVGSSITGGSSGSSGSTTTPGTTTTSASAAVQRYSQCIVDAHSDVAKMQRCAALINGK
jgi:hypothetical protein